jgi:hypothetical protein
MNLFYFDIGFLQGFTETTVRRRRQPEATILGAFKTYMDVGQNGRPRGPQMLV